MRAEGRALRAAIYASASNWAPLTRPDVPLAEQSRRCREAIDADPTLRRAATYRNRYANGEAGDYRRLVGVAEGWDTEASGGRAYAFHLRGMSRTERRAERRSEDGAQEQED